MARVKKGLNGVEKNVLGNRKAREAINKGELFHKTEDLRKELKVDHGNRVVVATGRGRKAGH